jgi:hypothetical protein
LILAELRVIEQEILQGIASLLRLRRCRFAAALRRACRSMALIVVNGADDGAVALIRLRMVDGRPAPVAS